MLGVYYYLLFIINSINNGGAKLLINNCPINDIKYEKVLGLRPSNDHNYPLILYKSPHNNNAGPITIQCLDKCKSNEQCQSFVIFYNISTCYWFKNNAEGTILDTNTAWFTKTCLKVSNCNNKQWIFERIPGAILIPDTRTTNPIKSDLTPNLCQQYCLNQTEFKCKSFQFTLTSENNRTGTCIFSRFDRHVAPTNYRVSGFDDEYYENQCTDKDEKEPNLEPDSNQNNNRTGENNNYFCAYNEYINITLAHQDRQYQGKSKDECEYLCETERMFNCRGFSILITTDRFGSNNYYTCRLHSEDSKIYGPRLLLENQHSRYYEKAKCINITISCTDTFMTVNYLPDNQFDGLVYMDGYLQNRNCLARESNGTKLITLRLPLFVDQCGIIQANSPNNRTLLAGTLIIQHNRLIQTQNDRLIRVGCIYGNDSRVLLGTDVKISQHLQPGSSFLLTSGNNASVVPTIEMRIVDYNTKTEVSDTEIGQELEMIIEMKQTNSNYDIWASSLISMTELNDESIYLIDGRGCPTDLNIFPKLTKIITDAATNDDNNNNNKATKLIGKFQAFKFASSPIIRFSVIVQFCIDLCRPIECGDYNKMIRNKRELINNGTTIAKINRTDFDEQFQYHQADQHNNNNNNNIIPLESYIIVRNTKKASFDRFIIGDSGKLLVAGYDFINDQVCLDYSMFIGLIVTWLLIQIILVVCCLMLVKRYKNHYENEYQQQSLEELHRNFGIGFSNLDNRRVRWADDQNEGFT